MIAPEDIKLLFSYLNDEQVDSKKLDKLTKKIELIVKQIDIQDEANKKLAEIREELSKI